MDPCARRGRDPSSGRGQGTRTGRPPTASGLPRSQAVVPEVLPVEAPLLVRFGLLLLRRALAVLVTEVVTVARGVLGHRGLGVLVVRAAVDVLGRRIDVGTAGGEDGQDEGRNRTRGHASADRMGVGVHGVSLRGAGPGWTGRSSTVGPPPERLTRVDRR